LAEDGNQIVVVEMLNQIGPDAFGQHLDDILPRLNAYKVDFIAGQKLIKITANSIVMANTSSGQQSEENIDHVVLSVGVKSNDKLAKELQPHFERIYTIGDARKIGRIAQAVRDGFDTAWNLV
jgi:NADH dehydrogenase FAD-containing subunit